MHNEFLQLNNKINQRTQFKNEQKNWVDISPKETYKWSMGTYKDAQYHSPPEMEIRTTMRYHLTPVTIAFIY